MPGSNWYISERDMEKIRTLKNYERANRGEKGEHEHVRLEALTEDGGSVHIDVYLDEEGAAVNYMTDVGCEPIFDVLDREYPPRRTDDMWVESSGRLRQIRPWEGFESDIKGFQFNSYGDPNFNICWRDRRQEPDDGNPAPFEVNIGCYDRLGMSLDRASVNPVQDLVPVTLRADISEEEEGRLMLDLLNVLDGEKDEPAGRLMNYFEEDAVGEIMESTAQRYRGD